MKCYDKSKESFYLKYCDAAKLCGWAMSQRLPEDGLKLIENISPFNKDFIKSYNEDSDEGYFIEFDIQYPENLYELHNNS